MIVPVKCDPSDAGCWISGHNGHYGPAMVVTLACDFGWPNQEAKALADRYETDHDTDADGYLYEAIVYACDEAEEWLNNNIAPDCHSFGWHDGEFFLWSDESWEDAY